MARTKKSRQRGSVGMQLARKAAHSVGTPFPRAAAEHSCRRCADLGPEYRYAEDVGGLCSEHEEEERQEDERESLKAQRAAEAAAAQAAGRVLQDAERVALRTEVAAALEASRPAGQRDGGAATQPQSVKRERERVSYALSAASPRDLVAHLQAVVNGGKSAEAALALAALLPASRFPPMVRCAQPAHGFVVLILSAARSEPRPTRLMRAAEAAEGVRALRRRVRSGVPHRRRVPRRARMERNRGIRLLPKLRQVLQVMRAQHQLRPLWGDHS